MNADDLFSRARGGLVARAVFGDPVERDGVTVIPVAMFVGGGGGGSTSGDAPPSTSGDPGAGSEPAGTAVEPAGASQGAGFGGVARGIGVFTVRDGEVRFVPATDRTLLVLVAMLVWCRVIMRILRKARHRPGT